MLQRIQTIYLFICLSLIVLLFLPPLVTISTQDAMYTYSITGLEKITDLDSQKIFTALPQIILNIVIILFCLMAIFLYRRRKLQMRFTIYTIILLLGQYGLFFYYFRYIIKEFRISFYHFNLSITLPAICVIIAFLAFRGIRKDELKVRSYDRIR